MRAALLAVLAALLLAGCASRRTNPAGPAAAAGRPANVSYGTIIALRPVTVWGGSNAGAPGGAPIGATAGSFVGGDVRSNILAAIGGPGLDGPVGNATAGETTNGALTEFIVREDDGQTISVVQGAESKLQIGQRVMIIRGPETRLAPLTRG